MSNNQRPVVRGFGPVALIVTGVVCFAAGYMVNDLTKALAGPVAVPAKGGSANQARDPDPTPAPAPATDSPAAPAAEEPEKRPDDAPKPGA